MIDDLTYAYDLSDVAVANRLLGVSEASSTVLGFKKPNTGGAGYTYDNNGNRLTNGFENITGTNYLFLNLPYKVTYGTSGDSIMWTYDAAGTKWMKKVTSGAVITEKRYIGNLEYLGSNLEAIYFSQGRAVPQGAGYAYEFTIRDHLGNARVMFKDTTGGPKIVSEGHYYPFGMTMGGAFVGSSNPYLYNGKEFNAELGYNLYDYGARWYDASVGRFISVDPLAHKLPSWSPYAAMACNPIMFFDPDGAFPYTFHIRAFAPPGAFKRTGFHDDNRGFSTSMSATSRIKQNFTVDPSKQTFTGGKTTSDPTVWNGISKTATDEGGASATFGKNSFGSATAGISANFEGSNPFGFGGAPDIEVSSAISITENLKTNQVFVALDISSKQFPATEGLIQDNAGNTLLLAGAAAYGNAGNLVRADKKQAATVDLIIGINDKGVFQNVTMGGKQYTLEEFNKLGTSKPAGPLPREDKDKGGN